MRKLDIWLGNKLGDLFATIGEFFEEGARHLKRCPSCGENLYYGRSCDQMGVR